MSVLPCSRVSSVSWLGRRFEAQADDPPLSPGELRIVQRCFRRNGDNVAVARVVDALELLDRQGHEADDETPQRLPSRQVRGLCDVIAWRRAHRAFEKPGRGVIAVAGPLPAGVGVVNPAMPLAQLLLRFDAAVAMIALAQPWILVDLDRKSV